MNPLEICDCRKGNSLEDGFGKKKNDSWMGRTPPLISQVLLEHSSFSFTITTWGVKRCTFHNFDAHSYWNVVIVAIVRKMTRCLTTYIDLGHWFWWSFW